MVLPVLSGEEPICPMEKPRVCIKDSSTVGSTKILGRRVRVERESDMDIKALFTESISFPGKQKSQVHMEIHYIDSQVLKTEHFVG